MTSRDFCYWLQGYLEVTQVGSDKPIAILSAKVEMIQKHLNLVFKHEIDPSFENQTELNEIHLGGGYSNDNPLVRC